MMMPGRGDNEANSGRKLGGEERIKQARKKEKAFTEPL